MVGFTARKTEGVNAVIARLAKSCVGFVALLVTTRPWLRRCRQHPQRWEGSTWSLPMPRPLRQRPTGRNLTRNAATAAIRSDEHVHDRTTGSSAPTGRCVNHSDGLTLCIDGSSRCRRLCSQQGRDRRPRPVLRIGNFATRHSSQCCCTWCSRHT